MQVDCLCLWMHRRPLRSPRTQRARAAVYRQALSNGCWSPERVLANERE